MENEYNCTAEMIEKAKAAKTPNELTAIAKESGIELTADEAKKYYEKLNKFGELADDELDNVSGGGCKELAPPKYAPGEKVLVVFFYDRFKVGPYHCTVVRADRRSEKTGVWIYKVSDDNNNNAIFEADELDIGW